jgi:hypothetical protein
MPSLMANHNIAIETEDFIYGNMEVHNLRIHQGRALQAPEMPPVRGQGDVREGVTILVLQGSQRSRQLPDSERGATQPSSTCLPPCNTAAQIITPFDLLGRVGGRQHHHRDSPRPLVGLYPLQHLESAQNRQVHVQEDEERRGIVCGSILPLAE